jgi:alkanesulfonate monooxygenase SsuD/methylene tetrahydromethanopterin reductase-like flavin-dependent oxidoreductase (luciferase family)
MTDRSLHLAVALDGTGWHPASWREPGARPTELFGAGNWAELVTEAERGLLDLVTIDDSLALQSERFAEGDTRTDRVRGRLDALLVAARVAPLTRHIGLVPTVVVTHTEPFHTATATATLDHVSAGRAGVQVRVSRRADEAALFGRRAAVPFRPEDADHRGGPATALFDEAADYVEVLRRLWDSWEDDAVIRDVATGRFVDRDRLHYIDFAGEHFAVRGPSITPRPPQGQLPVAALAHRKVPFALVGRAADLGFVTPRDAEDAAAVVAEIRTAAEAAGRDAEHVRVFGDLVVVLDDDPDAAAERKARLDERAREPLRSDASVFVGTPTQLAELALDWHRAGLAGLRLRPAAHAVDLPRITRGLVPELQRRGAFRTGYEADTLRGLLGLPRPANRYAPTPLGAAR